MVSDSLWSCGLWHAMLPCPSPTPRAYSNSCLLSRWCHPTISSSVASFYPQSFTASGSFLMSQLFVSGSQSFRASTSASVLPMNIQDWFPLGLTGLISLLSRGLSRVFSSLKASILWCSAFFMVQLSHLLIVIVYCNIILQLEYMCVSTCKYVLKRDPSIEII